MSGNVIACKYPLGKNMYARCWAEVDAANETETRLCVGMRIAGDTTVPIGTKISLQLPNAMVAASVQVKAHEPRQLGLLHVCSPILQEQRQERRQTPRKPCNFPVLSDTAEMIAFQVIEATTAGLTLRHHTPKKFTGFSIGKAYELKAFYKDEPFVIPVKMVHIQYDWAKSDHILGLQVLGLDEPRQIQLNKLIDPKYELEIKQKAAVDAAQGRIRPTS